MICSSPWVKEEKANPGAPVGFVGCYLCRRGRCRHSEGNSSICSSPLPPCKRNTFARPRQPGCRMSPFLCSQPPESGFAANSKAFASSGSSKISLRQKRNISVGKHFGQMSPTSHGSGFKGSRLTFMEISAGLCFLLAGRGR